MYTITISPRITSFLTALTLFAMIWYATGVNFIRTARAANLTNISDTLQSSNPSDLSNHTIRFTTPSGMNDTKNITITFPAGFDLSNLTENDIDVATGTDWTTTGTDCTGTEQALVTISGQTITIAACPGDFGTLASSSVVTIKIGSNATFSGTGLAANRIVNPSTTGSYKISIGGTFQDSGVTRVVILNDVTLSASVDSVFNFSINGLPAGAAVNGTTTTATSTATQIAFGTLAPNQRKVIGQELFVTTNAPNGYTVTLVQDHNLQSSTGADIDQFIDSDANGTSIPTAWVSPSGTAGLENTYGHFGYTTEDGFGSNLWAGDLGTATTVMSHTGVADGSTAGIGQTRVAFQVEITAYQEAGSDYTNTLTYVATPSF